MSFGIKVIILELEGKVAIVTGGNSGIGKAVAEIFAREKAKVVIAARNEQKGIETVDGIKRKGGTATFVKTDMRDPAQIKNLIDEIVRLHSTIDVLCNNAGMLFLKPLVDTTVEEWDLIMNTNLRGLFLASKYAIPHMMEKKKGVIVNIASQLGVSALEGMSAYCTTKAGIMMLTRVMALECIPHGIRVNCVCPGAIDTPMVDGEVALDKDPKLARRIMAGRHPIGRIGRPEEIAEAVLFMASDKASFIVGECLLVDGGYVIGPSGRLHWTPPSTDSIF
jgi:NAD(P)-dependent dehydrogenase (short-subunit alcohol dehydrogenase family)